MTLFLYSVADSSLRQAVEGLERHVPAVVAVLVAIGVGLGLLRRWIRKVSGIMLKWNEVHETLIGRPAIVHPDTGEVLAEATPGVGQRLAHIEGWQITASQTMAALAKTQSDIASTDRRLELHSKLLRDYMRRLTAHLDWTENEAVVEHRRFDERIDQLEARMTTMEERQDELEEASPIK